MDAGKRTINELFNGSRILEIPFFQRAYVWGEPQWERLLEDVETVSRTRMPYFMGSVILKQQLTSADGAVGDVRTVIDGQQRLTTLSILLKVLCLKTGSLRKFDKRFRLDDDRTVIQHNHNDLEAYSAVMELDCLQPTNRQDNISRAYQYFADHLDPDKVDFDIVCNAILFVGIDLGADENEQQIFDTINSLGIRKYSLEHLMPKKWRNHWVFSGDDAAADARDRTLLTLGNLTIITQSLNASIRDADWATKKAGRGEQGGLQKYAEGLETLSAYLDADVWDEAAIQRRADDLARQALAVWPI